jgi:hypothetical protein
MSSMPKELSKKPGIATTTKMDLWRALMICHRLEENQELEPEFREAFQTVIAAAEAFSLHCLEQTLEKE